MGMVKNCDNCKNSGRPSYEWPCTICTSAHGSAPSKWESIFTTSDFVEVVHGRWLTLEEYAEKISADPTGYAGGWRFCSECEQPMRELYGWAYCPNCGAKMDGGNGDG